MKRPLTQRRRAHTPAHPAVSPVVASLLLIIVAITASYLLYSVISGQQAAAKQASGPPTQPPLISIEGVTPTNYSITLYIRVENSPTTLTHAFVYDINNTLAARLFTLAPQTLPAGEVSTIEMYSDRELPPGHYQVRVTTPRGTVAQKYFENPTGTGKTTVLYNLTTAYTSDTNSLNTSDNIAIYKAWVDTLNNRVYWNVSLITTITYLRAALYNESGANFISGIGNNPFESTATITPPNYVTNWWAPVPSTWQPFVVVFTVKTQ